MIPSPRQPEPGSSKSPLTLRPPATIISPPSPIDSTSSPTQRFPSPPRVPSPSAKENDGVTVDSPVEESEDPSSERRAPSANLGPLPLPVAADILSSSPQRSPAMLRPESPHAATVGSPRGLSRTSSMSRPTSPRSASPTSPYFQPKGAGHRRESSTHRVRETMDGEQRSTDSGERMVNQYRIGKSLGKGSYANVELAVDVGTGTQFAIKEFSKSRLHFQALQEKHRQNSRLRVRRPPRGSPVSPDDAGKRKAGEGAEGSEVPKQSEPEKGDAQEEEKDDNGASGGDDDNEDNDDDDTRDHQGPWGSDKTVDDDPLGLIRREVAVMKKLDHPNVITVSLDLRPTEKQIVHLYEAISVPNADALFLVLEYMPGGVLMSVHVGEDNAHAQPPFDLDQAREYFRQLCLGLEYLHGNEVIHRDVKPDNVLLSADRETLKLCDFGVSEMFVHTGDDRIKKSGGSPAFLSPESFTAHTRDVHGKAVDIWALGVTLFCMLTGTLPFNIPNPIEMYEVVRNKERPSIPDDWEDSLKDLMHRMLEKDPTKRIAMSGIRENPWVTINGEEPLISEDDNLYHVGRHVEEPTQEELGDAIGTLRGVFTVIRAAQKMRRMQLHRRSHSGQSVSQTITPGKTTSPRPMSPTSGPSRGNSTNISYTSGSMDSYGSHPTESSEGTSITDTEDPSPSPLNLPQQLHKTEPDMTDEPEDMEADQDRRPSSTRTARNSSGATARKEQKDEAGATKAIEKLKINTEKSESAKEPAEDEGMVESPTSGDI